MTQLRGSSCVVTGGSGGIGRSLSVMLANRGAHITVMGRDEEALGALADEIGGRAVVCELATIEGIADAAKAIAVLAPDILVNAAGAGLAGSFASADPSQFGPLLTVDLQAPIALARAAVPTMLSRGRGHIVNVASIVGHTGHGGEAVYAAAKAGLIAFSDSLREECIADGVRVSVVSPGVVATPFFERRGVPYDRAWPAPIEPTRVARAVLRAIERDQAEVIVPEWMWVAVRLRGAAPSLYRRLARRFG